MQTTTFSLLKLAARVFRIATGKRQRQSIRSRRVPGTGILEAWVGCAQATARVSAIATGPRPPPSSDPGTVGTDEPLRIELGDGPGETWDVC